MMVPAASTSDRSGGRSFSTPHVHGRFGTLLVEWVGFGERLNWVVNVSRNALKARS
jgi:hypothetical protein